MQRLLSVKKGDRAEYLAQYILSSFAVTVPVPRQEDFGSDFHCSMLRTEGKVGRPYLPFNIQIKRRSDETIENGIRYGGLTDGGNWRRHEILQICQTDTPFLIGLVNTEDQWIDLFSTIGRFFVLTNWLGRDLPRELAFMPYNPASENDIGAGEAKELAPLKDVPGFRWELPMGQPIVRIRIADSEDNEKCKAIKTIIEPFLRIDQQNSVLHRLGLGYFEWPLNIRTDQPIQKFGIGMASEHPNSTKSKASAANLTKIVAGTLHSYKSIGRADLIAPWIPVLQQLPILESNQLVQAVIADAAKFAEEKAEEGMIATYPDSVKSGI